MTIDAVISKIFDFSKPTYFRWKKEQRPIILLLEKYFTKENLQEFLESGSIKKFDQTQIIITAGESIIKNFFFEHYSNKPKNTEFANYIFPNFTNYVNNLVVTNKQMYPHVQHKFYQYKYFTKHTFFEFIIDFQAVDNIDKAQIIEHIGELSEIKFFIILTQHENYLKKSSFKDAFFGEQS